MNRTNHNNTVEYHIHSREYLQRARQRLDEGSSESLFYAAFECRCGIEARLQQYLEAQHSISRKKKKGWQIAKLAKNLEAAFKTGDKIVEFAVSDPNSGELRYTLYYTPVTEKLQKMGEKIGHLMHAMNKYRPPEDLWWEQTRRFLESVYEELSIANVGNMLGVPLINPSTQKVSLTAEPRPGERVYDLQRAMGPLGNSVHVRVSYLDTLPDSN